MSLDHLTSCRAVSKYMKPDLNVLYCKNSSSIPQHNV